MRRRDSEGRPAATVHDGLPAAVAAMVRPRPHVDPDDRERDAPEASYGWFAAELTARGWLA
jgi:hypothetical protein